MLVSGPFAALPVRRPPIGEVDMLLDPVPPTMARRISAEEVFDIRMQ